MHQLEPSYLYNPLYTTCISVKYVLFSLYIGYFINISHINIKYYMKLYNIIQILICSYVVYGFSSYFDIFNIFGIGYKYDAQIEYFIKIHYFTKYLDWFDTLFIILNNKTHKQLTFLHLFHHSTINIVWGYLLYTGNGNGTVYFGAMINSFIHVLMYSHYLLTSFNINNPFKKYLTCLQILQFNLCLLHSVLILFYYKETSNYPVNLAWIQFIYQLIMIYLFTYKLNWNPMKNLLESYKKTNKSL